MEGTVIMPLKNTTERYGAVAKLLHWLIAIAIIGMLIVGYVMTHWLTGATRGQIIGMHKSMGLTILLLMIFRIIWRLTNKPPSLPHTIPKSQQRLARAMHFALYVLIIVTILVGWSMSGFGGHDTYFWGWFKATLPLTKNARLGAIGETLHYYLAWTIAIFVLLHAIAALHHHFRLKNNVLRSMWPFAKILKK